MSSSGSFREHAVFLTNHDETLDEALVTVNDGDYSEFSLLSGTRRELECSIVNRPGNLHAEVASELLESLRTDLVCIFEVGAGISVQSERGPKLRSFNSAPMKSINNNLSAYVSTTNP